MAVHFRTNFVPKLVREYTLRMSEVIFNRLYKNLNAKQREAVDTIQGPVMVIAGPGTGKTSILTLRIANILQKTDTAPNSILALTFTESGAYSMRRKLVEIIGGAAYRVGIFTFHGFSHRLISRYQESFPRIVGGRPATAADQLRILEELFLRNRFTLIRPFGDIFYYVPAALHAIRDLKRENISPVAFQKALAVEMRWLRSTPDRFHESGRFKGELKATHREALRIIEKSRELATVYEQYEDALSRERLFDFEDMIVEAIRALQKDRALLLTLQEQYQYILADEHQDANNAQNKVIELLCSFDDQPNLFIVGDEKQAIYRFQGASLENFLYFKRLYPRARLIALQDNYRSTQFILDASQSLMEKGTVPDALPSRALRPRLRGQKGGEKRNIRFVEFSRSEHEIAFVVSDIEDRLKHGIAPREIAILVRDNADALPFTEAFEKTHIPFSVRADEDIARDEELGNLLRILRAAAEPGNPTLFVEMLHADFLGVAPVALYELLAFCRARRVGLFDVLTDRTVQRKAQIRKRDALLRVFSDFGRWARLARNAGAGEAVETIARESGFVRSLLSQRGSLRSLEKLDALFAHLKDLSAHKRVFRLSDFLETLARLQKHGMRLSGKSARPEFYDSITLMTAHRAKGLEFDVVYIANVHDGHWGGRRTRSDFYIPSTTPPSSPPLKRGGGTGEMLMYDGSENEDERRLFFVALTRARKEVVLTMAREGEGGKPRLPSQFVADIDPVFFVREDAKKIEERLAQRTAFYLKPRINAGPSVTLKGYLQKVFVEQGLTVTALNNYLSCPWEYFFKNLVRVPQLPEPYLSYGTAMHEALHGFFNRYREKKVGRGELLRLFDRAVEKSPLPLREFGEYKRRGRAALSGYFEAHRESFVRDTVNEFEITGVFLPLFGKEKLLLRGKPRTAALLLRGKLDKIERNRDGTVTVIDYKTGRPKSRAEILGETKTSTGAMKRQLGFYKLLLEGLTLNRLHRGLFASPRSPEPFAKQNVLREKRLNLGEMTTGVIDFLEPDSKGNYHREAFRITDKDVAALAEEVQRVGKEIYELAFWDKRCKNRKCGYCRLRQSLH